MKLRWWICILLFLGTTINYIDRQVLGILAPLLQEKIAWTESEYGLIVTSFQGAYAIGFPIMGYLMDKIGTKPGYAFSVIFWSLAAMSHALAKTPFGFGIARFALGLGEAGNFPAVIKTVAEWFPQKERSFATGILNSGTNIGAIIAPLAVPFIALRFGWQWAFILTGLIGFIWIFLWWYFYYQPADHPLLSDQERAYILQDPQNVSDKISWIKLMGYRQTWAISIGKFMTDPIWWFFLFWLPKFLYSQHGLALDKIGPPLIVIYLLSDVGSIAGGALSSFLIARGWSVNAGRKITLLICALAVTPIYFASQTTDLWKAVCWIGLATAAHQAWSANMYTLASDLFPRKAVGSVVGFASMFGAIGGMIVATGAGYILQFTGSYIPLFIIAGCAYLVALALVHLLAPKLAPVNLDRVN